MLRINNLSKSFSSKIILSDFNLNLNKGEKIVVYGPSGSGKTTLLRLIAGFESPDKGEIFLRGQLISSSKKIIEPNKRKLGFVFQEASLWPHMTVIKNIKYGLNNTSNSDEKLKKLIEILEIHDILDKFPWQISGGEARRVSIARTMAPSPDLVLMDEPLVNLDNVLKKNILNKILEIININKTTLMYVTHDKEESQRITANKIAIKHTMPIV